MRGPVVTNVDWLLPKSPPERRDIYHGDVIQSPEQILIESGRPLLQANFNAICQQVVLPDQVLLLNPVV